MEIQLLTTAVLAAHVGPAQSVSPKQSRITVYQPMLAGESAVTLQVKDHHNRGQAAAEPIDSESDEWSVTFNGQIPARNP